MSSQIINKNIIYGIFAIIYYGLTMHTIRKNISVKYIVPLSYQKIFGKVRKFKNNENAYSIYNNSNLGTLPMQFSGNFAEKILKNYEWKHFCYSVRKYFWINLEVRDVGMD